MASVTELGLTDKVVREWEEFAINSALEAGQIMLSSTSAGVNRKTESKCSPVDLVTETDKRIEDMIFSRIKQTYPDHRTIGEETSSSSAAVSSDSRGSTGEQKEPQTTQQQEDRLTDSVTWILDPIDGTMNFVHTFPLSCISIGVTYKKTIVLGVVYNPFLDQLFTARLGQGAYLNGKPIHVSGCRSLDQALVIAELGSARDEEKKDCVCRNAEAVIWKCHGLRSLGSAAMNMCSIACGGSDAYYEFGLHAWDMCGSAIIVCEAGGTVIDTEGGPLDLMNRRIIAASSTELAHQLSKTLTVHLKLERD